jgi:hypothetical protein
MIEERNQERLSVPILQFCLVHFLQNFIEGPSFGGMYAYLYDRCGDKLCCLQKISLNSENGN